MPIVNKGPVIPAYSALNDRLCTSIAVWLPDDVWLPDIATAAVFKFAFTELDCVATTVAAVVDKARVITCPLDASGVEEQVALEAELCTPPPV